MTTPYNARFEAVACMENAEKLLQDDQTVRHACLELRLCLEHTVFDQLKVYLQETPDEALKKWTPRDVIAELLEVDENAQDTATYFARKESSPGVPTGRAVPMGIDRRLDMKWASRAHSALGSFLHVPTLAQLDEGKAFDPAAARKKAQEIIVTLKEILSAPYFRANFGTFAGFDCIRCKRHIRRRMSSVPDEGIVCPNRACGARYSVVRGSEGKVTFTLKQVPFRCECQSDILLDEHEIREHATFKCPDCQRRYGIDLAFFKVSKDETSLAEQATDS